MYIYIYLFIRTYAEDSNKNNRDRPADRQTDRGTSFTIVNHLLTFRDRVLKVEQHSSFHVGPSIVFWLVLQLKVLHEIIVTIEVLQDTVQISNTA